MIQPRHRTFTETEIPWISRIPAAWKVLRIKDTTYVKGRVGWKGLTSNEYVDAGYAYLVTGTDFRAKFIDWKSCYQVDQFRYEDDPFIQLENGDLLITKDGTIGKLAIVSNLTGPACLNSGIFLVRPNHSYVTEYLYWVLASEVFTVFCDLTSYGSTIQHLYQNTFERFSFPVPPPPEQTDIAAFLDRKTAKIDALVEEQKRLIDLLKEKRQAVISHAVTKGLNPDAPMKDSGIEWLGEVPEHWEVKPLRYLCSLLKDGTHLPPPRVDDGVPLLSVRNIQGNSFTLLADDSMISPQDYDALSKSFVPKPDDVLLAIVGATLGKSAVIPVGMGAFHIQRSLAIFRLKPSNLPPWLHSVFQSSGFQSALWQQVGYSAQPGIYLGALSQFRVPVPPESEQGAICAYISRQTQPIDDLISGAFRALELLQERRAALISAAVTGKIDVRSVAQTRDAAE